MTRYNYGEKDYNRVLKILPGKKVEKCPIPRLTNVNEIYGRYLAIKRRPLDNPIIEISLGNLQEAVDQKTDLSVVLDKSGEPCLGVCKFYGGEALWCKYEMFMELTPQKVNEYIEILNKPEESKDMR